MSEVYERMSGKACEGGMTRSVRTTEHMQECLVCKMRVRDDLVDDRFFGFVAGCTKSAQRRSAPQK